MAADDYHIVAKHGKTTTASAVSPNSIKRPALKDRVPAKPDMPEVNTFMICQLCSGYLIDATAIIECQHTFCKSCILKYLETSSYCPVCDVQLNKGTPHLSLRSDVILQRLVYKLVPGLLVSEIRRRRDFSIKKGIDYPEAAELASNSIAEEIETPTDLPTVLTLDDVVSLSIEYYRSGAGDKGSSADTASSNKVADTNGKPPQQSTVNPTATNTTTGAASTTTQSSQNQQQKSNVKSNANVNSTSVGGSNAASANTNTSTDINSGNNDNEQANDRRYLQCPAAVSVGLLKKFIRMKYGLSDDYRVDLLYNGDCDSILENDLTLVDVAFIFKWNNKEEPMNIHYRIFERPVKSVTVYAGMKRPAPSVMDEPPDDDTASGPHNRSSMFSSSSAPSSKLPRLADNTSTSGNQGSVRNSNTSGKSTSTSTEAPATAATSLTSSSSSTASASKTAGSLSSKSTNNNASSNSTSSSSTTTVAPTHHNTSAAIKVEKEEAEEDEDNDDDDEDEEEDYELVERKEHMKGIKSSRRLNNKIKESMKRSVAVASSNSNIRSHHNSSSRSHSTDTKGSTESERESARNENSLNSSSNKRNANISVNKKRGKSTDEGKGKSGKVESLRLRVSSTSSSSSNSSDNNHQHQPLKLSISTTGATPSVVSSSSAASVEKKEPLKLSLGSVLANKAGSKSPDRKHHKHKHHHHHHHKLRHRDKQGKGAVASATVTNNSQKPLKLSFTLSPPSATTMASNQSQKSKQASQESGSGATAEVKEQQNQSFQTTSSSGKGKPLAGMQNYNNSARTSASAHGHLNNISKSISVSVNTNANANNNTTNTSSSSANTTKGSQQHGNKMLSPAELIPKNTGIEIQPTTMPISSSHGQMSSHQQQHSAMQSGSSASGNNNSHKHSHPLLPDSVHVPKSVTLIPVNPNQMSGMSGNHVGGVSSGQNMGKMNNTLNTGITMSSSNQDKNMSGSQGNQHRINSHTFTHPITNKSLHQITVTEVPPPQQKSSGSNAVVVTTTSTTHSSISVSTSNPIEKVIANAANKPQFNGPGSMEITKIYCGTSSSKDNAAKKLKDRKGLDISITGPGINVSMNKPNQKLEEALRQKVNMAIGGGSGSISVTPAAPPNNNMGLLNSGGNSGNNNMNTGNKMKSVSAAAASLLSGKMPPGITIGPATVPNTSSNMGNHNNSGSNISSGVSGMNNMMNSANAGNNIMKGLGFTLPPHLTAHPHTPNNTMKIPNPNSGNNSQAKSDKIMMSTNTMNANRVMVKDSVSIIGKGNVTGGLQQQQQQPPPVEITISASGGAGSKSQANITSRGGISIVNKSKMSNDPLASIFDITQGLQRKSPTPAINSNNTSTTKDTKGMPTNSGGGGGNNASSQQANKNANMANKRPFELVSIGGVSAVPGAQGNNKKPTAKESPEQKKSRSASTSSEPDKNKNGNSSSSTGEIPLDLSGRSTRTTPPITIPNPRESSKSPSEKPRKSPERAEKPGIVITPSASQLPQATSSNLNKPTAAAAAAAANNFLSPKINIPTQKNSNNSPAADSFKGQTKSVSVSKLSPNQSSKISSIVDSLAQKQAQAQQQQQQQNLQNYKNAQNQQHQQNMQNMKNSQLQQQQLNLQNMKNSQIQQQQQNLQNMKNSQNQQQQQHLQNMKNSQQQQQQQSHHHPHSQHNPSSNTSSSAKIRIPSPNNNAHSNNSSNSTTKSSPGGNNTKVSPSSSGLNSPISASPVSPMTSPSPPAGDHLRNLWTLSNSANQQGKLNQMNELLVAASLFSPSGHPHLAGAAAAHQLAAAAAAAVAASGSPSGAPATGATGGAGANSAFNSNLFAAQFGHHLAALGAANKIPPGMFDPHFMAALNAHNAQAAHVAAAAGMRMHHPFVGGMSPPLNMPNAFFPPHGAPGNSASQQQQQQQQQPTLAAATAGLKIPSVASKQGASPSSSSAGQPGKSPNSAMSYSPMFSHSHASPKSPNSTPLPPSSSISMKSPTSGSAHTFTAPSSMPGNTTTVSNHGNNTTTKHEPTKHNSSHSHTSAAGKSSHQHHHHQHHHTHDSPSTHSTNTGGSGTNPSSGSKSTKINGTVSTAMPVFPPGIHNPLLPSRSSTSSNSSGNSFQSGSSAAANTAALNKSFSALSKNFVSPSSNNSASNPIKGAIPNSMKISNFLPSKPKDASSDANAEATITSGSNFGIMPPLQAKPNFSLSPTRSVSNNLISPSVNIPKSPSAFNSKESGSGGVAAPISPVKGVGGTAVTNNKPSTMTCASLLRPDSLYSTKPTHHPTHHLMNSLSPPKGDNHHHSPQQQHHLGSSCSSRLTNRTPSSDSALLSPGSASTNKTPSPGASTSNKSPNMSSKDGFRSSEPATQQHHHSSNKSLSPSKEIIASKKEIGSIPSGPAAALGGLSLLGNRNFTSAAAVQSLSLARPIPTIPAFLNRTASITNPCTLSSNINLHNLPFSKDVLQQKSTSPSKISSTPTSPVKMSNEQKTHPHLPSPVFPFPGVSVPVQVKLQDDDEAALPAVTSAVTTTSSLSASASVPSAHTISLKSEVNKLLAAKEEKMEEKRKRSFSLDQESSSLAAVSSSNLLPKTCSSHSDSETTTMSKIKRDLASPVTSESNKNSCEIPPPAKLQKIEMQAGVSSSVKNENTESISEKKFTGSSNNSESIACEQGTKVKSESELLAQQESKGEGEGERIEKASNEKKGDADVVVGADPSKEFSTCAPANATSTTTTATPVLFVSTAESPSKSEVETPSPVKAVEVSVEKVSTVVCESEQPAVVISESETQTKEETSEEKSGGNVESSVVAGNEKSTTQVTVDMPRKSDDTSIQIGINPRESESSFEIPKEQENGQLKIMESVEGCEMADDNNDVEEVDVEMVKDQVEVLGQSEAKQESDLQMDTNEGASNQMEVDAEPIEENKMDEPVEEEKQNIFVEERVKLVKAAEDEDVDVDVLDVGVDDQMETNIGEMSDSVIENDGEAEELCIDDENNEKTGDELVLAINEQDSMEVGENEEETVKDDDELIQSQSENDNSSGATTTVPTSFQNDDSINTVGNVGEDMSEEKDVGKEEEEVDCVKDPVEISVDVIKRQKVEETNILPETQTEENLLATSQVAQESINEEPETVSEENDSQVESTFLAGVNEASNFSQDDSECGDLVIDLGPNAGENEVDGGDADDNDDDGHEPSAENEENNEKEAIELLTQNDSNHSAVVQLEIKEIEENAEVNSAAKCLFVTSQNSTEPQLKDCEEEEIENALPILSTEETIQVASTEEQQGEENVVQESPSCEETQEDDDDVGTSEDMTMMMESSEPTQQVQEDEQQVAHVYDDSSLNQDSFPNQITINPPSIEVNGVIKTDKESEKREESESKVMLEDDVAECPQQNLVQVEEQGEEENVNDYAGVEAAAEKEERGTAEFAEHSGNRIDDAPEEDNKNTCEVETGEQAESTVCGGVMVESNAQLDNENPVTDTTIATEDNKNTADNNEASSSAVDDKKIEEEQEQLEQQQLLEEQKLLETAMLPESESFVSAAPEQEEKRMFEENVEMHVGIGAFPVENVSDDGEDMTAPVIFPEEDNKTEESENIVGIDDSSSGVQEAVVPTITEEVDMGTPMEIEESMHVEECEEMMMVDAPVEDTEMTETETTTLTMSEIDDKSMQMDTDNGFPSEDSSTCVPSFHIINDQILSCDSESGTETTPMVAESDPATVIIEDNSMSMNSNSTEELSDVAVISATITTTSAAATSDSLTYNISDSEVTPTTSTSSVAINVDIEANDNDNDDDDDAKENAAASLSPSSINSTSTTTISSSSLIIPSSNNTSASSSSSSSVSASCSSSPVDVPTTTTTGLTGIGSKSLETFGKVAAGLLASATSTINNNNNNTSLTATTCDAISIATTNANA